MGNSRYVFYCVTFSVATFLTLSGAASAELYQYTDADGVTHLTDDPQQVPPKLRDKSRREADAPPPEPKQTSFFDTVRPDSLSQNQLFSLDMKKPARKVAKPVGVQPQFVMGGTPATKAPGTATPQREPDKRLASPESAILFFRLAMREFSMRDIEACTTPDYWQHASTRFATMGSGALKGAESRIFSIEKTIQDSSRAEYSVVVVEAGGTEARYVMTVEKINGEWRISNF